jgi:prepilin-type N-terminal cleavage/methylation domain-containing protein
MRRPVRGFSLVEVAVALAVLALVFTASINLVTRANQNNDRTGAAGGGVDAADGAGRFDPAAIDQALLGFLRANHRLPCPDVSGNGLEDCTLDGQPVAVGRLPVATLQLSYPPEEAWRLPIDYGVYRGVAGSSDLAVSRADRFTTVPFREPQSPACPPGINTADCDVGDQNLVPSVVMLLGLDVNTLNVLDSCRALSNARSEAEVLRDQLLHSGRGDVDPERVNVAYALAWSSTASLLAGDDLLESRQAGAPQRFFPANFSPPGSDDLTLVRSFLELSQALECSSRLGDVDLTYNTAATLATSEYLNRVRLAHMKLFKDDADSTVQGLERDLVFGAVDVALASAGLLLAIAEGTQGNPVAAVSIGVGTAELANTIAGLVLTSNSLSGARDFVIEVEGVVTLARERLNTNGDRLVRAQNIAELVQQRGQL